MGSLTIRGWNRLSAQSKISENKIRYKEKKAHFCAQVMKKNKKASIDVNITLFSTSTTI